VIDQILTVGLAIFSANSSKAPTLSRPSASTSSNHPALSPSQQ
jgi:hypothetical protein